MFPMSYSAYNAWHTCPRKYFFSYVLRWEPLAVPSYFADGRLFHTAAELYATGVSIIDVVKRIRKEAEKARTSSLSVAEHSDITIREGKIAGMISAFAAVRGKAPYGRIDTTHTEEWVSRNADGGIGVIGKVDLINRNAGLIVDFKTTGQLDPSEIEAERISMQYYLYGNLYEATSGCRLKDIIVEIVAKPNLRLKGGEALDQFAGRITNTCLSNAASMIARVVIPWNKKAKELGEYYFRQVAALGKKLAPASVAAPRRPNEFSPVEAFPPVTNSCKVFSLCEFFPICSKNMLKIPAKSPMGFRLRQKSE